MVRAKLRVILSLILASCLLLNYLQSANAIERKKPDWLASCPEVIDVNPSLETPKTRFLRFQNTGQVFSLLAHNSVESVREPNSIIGCYVIADAVTNRAASPEWQIGSLNRDASGFYFKNAAGITWRLLLSTDGLTLETLPGSLYYKSGLGFKIDEMVTKATDCKVRDSRLGSIRLGFPRNSDRVPQLGVTQNLILVIDFPDARLNEDLKSVVDNVLSPATVEKFFTASSNGKFSPKFSIFPTVITLNSLDSSFLPYSTGNYLNNGAQQDHRMVKEALSLAGLKGSLNGYSSINVFAPTSRSLGYYGSAFLDLALNVSGSTLLNSQLVGQVGTISSPVPSWKVFAHEYGHLLGMYDYYIPGNGNTGKSPGPFDFMGNTTGNAPSFFGFQRWVQGWIEDSQVICDNKIDSSTSHILTPLNENSGKKLYVHPIDGSIALAIELRTESEFDSLNGNDGLLVYLIDMNIGSLQGPISIQPSEQDVVINPRDDVEKYSRAPLSSGQYVKVKDVVVFAEVVSKKEAKFMVLTAGEFQTKLESLSKEKMALEQEIVLGSETKTAVMPVTKPVIKAKTIICFKGKSSLKVIGKNPKCPSGYKKKA